MISCQQTIELTGKQETILDLLIQKPYMQKDLAKAIGISPPGLLYHLNQLSKYGLIQKQEKTSVGAVSLNEISLDPNSIQRTRELLGKKSTKYTLITGFGKDSDLGMASILPSNSTILLQNEGYNITRVVAFCTPDSNVQNAKRLGQIDRLITHKYEAYRDGSSELMSTLENTIQTEQTDADLILDLTPLSKLLTIRLLQISNAYRIPSFYLGLNTNREYFVMWIVPPSSESSP
jgi:DNA-binding CsgD family transcriptional regulator